MDFKFVFHRDYKPSGLEYLVMVLLNKKSIKDIVIMSKALLLPVLAGILNDVKRQMVFFLVALLALGAKAATTTKEVQKDMVNYTLVTVTESSSWATARTRAGGKTTRYAVVKSGAPNALGAIGIRDTIMDGDDVYTVMSISSHAFENMYLITSVTMPESIDEIGTCAFKGCSGLQTVSLRKEESGARVITPHEGESSGSHSKTKRAMLFSTEKVGDSAFEDCISLAQVRLSSRIKKIGNRAYANCQSLKSVSFAADVQNASVLVPYSNPSNFGTEVFADCRGIETVYADRWVNAISEDTFADIVYARKNLSCPEDAEEKLKNLGGWKRFFTSEGSAAKSKTVNVAVAGTLQNYISESEKYSIEELTITGQLNGTDFRLIRDMAGCNYLGELTDGKLKRLDLSGATIVAGGEKYLDAEWVHFSPSEMAQGGSCALLVPDEISERLFMCCQFEQIVLPKSIGAVGDYAFYNCPNLTSISIPEGVRSIGEAAFISCVKLTRAELPQSLTALGRYAFAHDKKLEYVNIPSGITVIEDATFFNCAGLSSISLPDGLTEIDSQPFEGCSGLRSVTIPKQVSTIGVRAFYGCVNLERVEAEILNPATINYYSDNGAELFSDETYNAATLNVPQGTKALYQQTMAWKRFASIVEMGQNAGTLTLMVNRCEREYGDDNPNFTYTAEGGAFTGNPEITCEATRTSPVGIYPITISKGSIHFDGKITFINANLSVKRARLKVTADNKTMTVGDPLPELTVTYTGFKNNETEEVLIRKPSLSTTATSQSPSGTYPIYVSGAYAENYNFDYADGRLTITEKTVAEIWKHTLILNLKNGSQRKYPLRDLSDVKLTGSDVIVATKTASNTFRRADILEFRFINAATDYGHVVFTADSYSRPYGAPNPTFTFKAEGAGYTGKPIITCEAASTSPVGTYPILISQGSVDNDNSTFVHGVLTVTKAPLTVTADDQTISQGDDIPELTVSYDGFVNGETESVLIRKPVATTTATSSSAPGEYPIVARGGVAENYQLYYRDGVLTIEAPAPVAYHHTLIMHLNNGTRERYILSEEPLFVVSGEKLVVKTANMGAVYLRSDIKEFTFEDTADGIQTVSDSNEMVIRQLPNGDVAVSGLDTGAIVRVYDLNGRMVFTAGTHAGEELVIPLENRVSGVYIINIDNKRTIKIQKK